MNDHEKRIREALEADEYLTTNVAKADLRTLLTDLDMERYENNLRKDIVASGNQLVKNLEVDLDRLRDNLDAMQGALEKISGLGMSQFFKPYDMAEEAQNIARTALKGASHE